ncbi:Uncharacterized protein GBIM_07727 [Gryllus bimaculatus]|nr:Uncharacterized protein GBIM_07727 [Gryllus bimaculatus]
MFRLCANLRLTQLPKSVPKSFIITLGLRRYSSPAKEAKISVDGVNINYVKVGTGQQNVLCFPGMLGTIWTDFKPQIEKLDTSKLTVFAWDPPGYGGSFPPNRTYPPDFYYQDAEWALKFMKALNVQRFSLLGWSDGGISSLILAAKHPGHIEKLIVWGANAFVTAEDTKLYEGIRDLKNWSDRMKAPLIKIYGEEYLSKTLSSWVDALVDIQKNQVNGDICRWLLPFIQCPTLIIHGAKDPMVPSLHPQYLLENIKGARYHEFPDGKHNLHLKYADEFNKLVEEFLLQ